MIKIAPLIFALAFSGCSAYTYQHTAYDIVGNVVAQYQITAWRNAVDVGATSEKIWLADGTVLEIVGGSEQPDKSVVAAVANIGDAILGIGAIVLKFFGL